jgi:leukotriene-A4 hydrolase
MWLNEGFTVFEERKVSERVHGTEFALIEAQLGNVSLWEDINSFGASNNFSSLHPDLTHSSPDDSFSEVPYEKGFQFITFIESLFKTKADFEDLLRMYILTHSQQSVDYEDFKASLITWVDANYTKAEADELKGKIDWQAWVFGAGPNPPNQLDFSTVNGTKFEQLADAYIELAGEASPDNYTTYNTMGKEDPQLQVIFLNRLQARQSEVTLKLLAKIDADLSVTMAPNPEIGQRWFPLSIALKYNQALDQANHYVSY